MTDLPPAAQAVLDAAMQYEINPECYSREIAAALRAAADQGTYPDENGVDWILADVLLAIAAKLEASR
jgi:hypothetical protein